MFVGWLQFKPFCTIQLLQIAIHFIALGVELSDQREKKYWRVSSLHPFNRFLKTTRDTTKTGKFLISSAQQECNYINHLTVQSYLSHIFCGFSFATKGAILIIQASNIQIFGFFRGTKNQQKFRLSRINNLFWRE